MSVAAINGVLAADAAAINGVLAADVGAVDGVAFDAGGGGGGGIGTAGPHRYWRVEDIVLGSGTNLEMSEIQLWYAGARVSGAATISGPASISGHSVFGTSNLNDNNTGTVGGVLTSNFSNSATYFRHVIAYTFDFGVGNTQNVDAIKLGAHDTTNRYPSAITLAYSDDGSTWTQVARATGLSYPGNSTLSAEIPLVPKGELTSPAVFTYIGSAEEFIVPGGVTSMTAKMWGAGGGAFYTGSSGDGGGGGYAEATFAVTPGESLFIYVGEGGGPGPADRYGGGGGGATGIYRGSTPLVVAGGGGGGATTAGGAGGGSSGVAGSGAAGGQPGTSSAAGAAGTPGSGRPSGSAGSGANGGRGADTAGPVGRRPFGFGSAGEVTSEPGDGGGGSGGGGYYGGGGGSVSNGGVGHAGGGGSGYAPGGTNTAGSGATPGNSSDSDRNGAGQGGNSTTRRGADGRLILSW